MEKSDILKSLGLVDEDIAEEQKEQDQKEHDQNEHEPEHEQEPEPEDKHKLRPSNQEAHEQANRHVSGGVGSWLTLVVCFGAVASGCSSVCYPFVLPLLRAAQSRKS